MINLLIRIVGIEYSKILLGAFLLTGLYYFLSFKDTMDQLETQLNTLKSQKQQEEVKAKDTKSTEERAQLVQQNVTKLSQNLDEIQKKLPNNITTSDVISYIEGFARKPQIQISSKKPLATEKIDIIEKLPLDLEFNATYAQLGTFFVQAGNFETITTISKYRISRSPTANNKSALKVEMTINGYRSLENKEEIKKDKK